MKKLVLALWLCATCILTAQQTQKAEALDSVMITTKINIPEKNSGKVVTTITRAQLANKQGQSIAQVLNQIAGFEINGSRSNDGQNLGYYIRGGRNRQVLIVVDGVAVNDPSSIANDYDLRLIAAQTIERIEIIKGASSTLYGSGAATAVISITTLADSKETLHAIFSSSVSTNRSAEDNQGDLKTPFTLTSPGAHTSLFDLSGTLAKVSYNVSFTSRYADGLSAVEAPQDAPQAFLSDRYTQYQTRGRVTYQFNKNISYSHNFSFGKVKADFDSFNYTDASNQNTTKQVTTGGQLLWKYNKGMLVVNDSYTFIDREFYSSFPSKFESKAYGLDAYGTYKASKNLTLLVGLGYNSSSFTSYSVPFGATQLVKGLDDNIANFTIVDPYLNLHYISSFGLNINAGARLNNHNLYGSHAVYNINPSYNFNIGKAILKVLGSYSTAYITPSLFQIHAPEYGNLELEPEQNATLESGFEFTKTDKLRVSVVYFDRTETNFIDFVTVDPDNFVYQYQNIDTLFNASGLEVEAMMSLTKQMSFNANYTNTQPDARFVMRIPKHKANAQLSYTTERGYVSFNYQFVGDREDYYFNNDTFTTDTITLDSFSTLDLSLARELSFTDDMRIFLNISNILNQDYQELYRYQTRGRNITLGFTLGL